MRHGITVMEGNNMALLDGLRAASAAANDPNNAADQAAFAPAWRWENAGDGIEGVVVSTGSRVTDNHPEGYPIVTVRQANGEDLAIHGLTTVLKNEINEKNVRVGDTFAAIYDGKKAGGSGRQYHAFRVAHQAGTGAPIPAAAAVPAAPATPDPWVTAAKTSGTTDIPPF
jgi:hypothetical protein